MHPKLTTSLAVTDEKLMTGAVRLAADWDPARVWVISFAQHVQPFGAVGPRVRMTVDFPVLPVHWKVPAVAPPAWVVIVAHAPVPERVGFLPPAIKSRAWTPALFAVIGVAVATKVERSKTGAP